MLGKTQIAALVAALLPASAAASDKGQEAYETMTACFIDKAKSLDDLTTPLDDMADVIIGMCWEEVTQNRRRWTTDWGIDWSPFVGPYFVMHVRAKAKEAVYLYRMTRNQHPAG